MDLLKPALMLLLAVAATSCDDKRSNDQRPAAAAAAPSATGAVEGTVRVTGQPPAPAQLPTNEAVKRRCGEAVSDPSLVVGDGGALVGAVVFAVNPPAQPTKPPAEVVLDQKGCVFIPSIIAAQSGATLVIKNSDPLTHNVRAIRPSGDLFNVAMPLEGMKMTRKLPDEAGVTKLHCDIHPWMNAVARTFDHPFFAQTDAQGRFRIEGLPAGRHALEVWHPRLPPQQVQVDIPTSGAASVQVAYDAQQIQPQ